MSIGKWNLMWYVVMRWSPCLSRYSYMVIGFEFKYGSACEWNDGRWEFRLYIDQVYLHYRFLFKWIVGLSADNLSSCLDEGNTHTLPTMSFLSFSFSFIKLLKKNKTFAINSIWNSRERKTYSNTYIHVHVIISISIKCQNSHTIKCILRIWAWITLTIFLIDMRRTRNTPLYA